MNKINKIFSLAFALIGTTQIANGQNANNIIHLSANSLITYVFLAIIGLVFLVSLLYQYFKFNEVFLNEKKREKLNSYSEYTNYLNNLNSREIEIYLKSKNNKTI